MVIERTYAIASEAGTPRAETVRSDRSVHIRMKLGINRAAEELTQCENASEGKANKKQGEANNELVVFADSGNERTASSSLPDLMQ